MVHLSSSIPDDLDVLGEEFVSELDFGQQLLKLRCGKHWGHTRPNSAGKVFFFARSPDAPKTMIVVLSLSSMVLLSSRGQSAIIIISVECCGLVGGWGDGAAELTSRRVTHPAFSGSSGRCIVSAMMDDMV